MKKIGIITFHNSYNCGSMLESYAMQKIIEKKGYMPEIIDFSSDGQKELYSLYYKKKTLKNFIKNIILFFKKDRIIKNNEMYEEFKSKNFKLSKNYKSGDKISDKDYSTVIAGSDQIWNITIKDYDDAYFLNWVKNAKKVAYSPSFGAKNIIKYSSNPKKFANYINSFDALSIRENNGKKWIKDLTGKNVNVLLDPTLLLNQEDYDCLLDNSSLPKEKYIFLYSPSFNDEICKYTRSIAKKYNLKVITWSTKHYYIKNIKKYGFELPKYETPAVYLSLIKNAELVITTSYHGTIFSTIYKKIFITVKNGEMYGDDDRVITLLNQIDMNDRLIPPVFDNNFNYLEDINYDRYNKKLTELRKKSNLYLDKNIIGDKYENS